MSIIIGIDHGYYAIKTARCSFPAGRSAARMFCAHCGWAAADQLRTRQTQVQRLSAAEQSACELQV